jgi:CDP-diacylglycerol---serine O-phosphatidyltransferase
LRLARFNVMAERESKAPWQSEFFVGVPAPAGAALVLLPVYIGFLDVEMTLPFAYASTAYTIVIAYLLVSRLPVWSGKSETSHIRRDLVFPMILGVVLYVALLMSFTWQVLVVTVVLYLCSLPLGARNWHKRYGTLTIGEESAEKGLSEIDRGV